MFEDSAEASRAPYRQEPNIVNTHIFVPSRVPNQVLHDVLRSTGTHPSSATWASDRHIRSSTLPRILSVFLPLPFARSAILTITEHGKGMGCDDRWCGQSIRHILDRKFLCRPFVQK